MRTIAFLEAAHAWCRRFITGFRIALSAQAQLLGVSTHRLVSIQLWIWVCLLSLLLLPCGARAQVANICSAGKTCQMAGFRTSDGTAAAPAWSWWNDTNTGIYRIGADQIGVSTAGVRSFNFNATAGTLEGTTSSADLVLNSITGARLRYVLSSVTCDSNNCSTSNTSDAYAFRSLYGYQSGATGSGTAFASFPAAAAGNASRMIYDSTNACLRVSNGTTWAVVNKEWSFSAYQPALAATALFTVHNTTTNGISAVTNLSVSATTFATVTGGNVAFSVYDSTAGSTLCTLTLSCIVGAGTTSCTGAVPAAHVIMLRMDSSGCTGGGVAAAYNITAQFSGG